MTQEKVQIKLKKGLQSRSATLFVQAANRFSSEIFIEEGNKKLNAKSIIGIMSLAAKPGTEMFITAHGSDEMEAIDALKRLVSKEDL